MGKILLVEDDLEFAELIFDFLGSRSIEVEVCDDPFKALALNLNEYDLVLLDLGLPGIDGLEVCKEFRAKSKIKSSLLAQINFLFLISIIFIISLWGFFYYSQLHQEQEHNMEAS